METTAIKDIRKQVKKSIDLADDTTIKIIQAILDVQEKEAKSHSFEDELNHRFEEMEMGKNSVKLTIDQLERRARSAYKKRIQAGK